LSLYQQALKLEPTSFPAWEGIGKTLIKANEFSQAEICYRRLLEMNPDSLDYRISLGKCLVFLNQLPEASSLFAQVLKKEPAHPVALLLLGDAFLRMGQFQSARSCFLLLVKLQPESCANWYNLGMTLSLLHKPNEAEESYRNCLRLNPEHFMALNNYALSLLIQGKLREGFNAYLNRTEVRLKPKLLSRDFRASDFKGKPLHILADQGLGDQIFFLRFLRYLPLLGVQKIVFEGDERLSFLIPDFLPETIVLLETKPMDAVPVFIADLPYYLGFFETMLLPEIVPFKSIAEIPARAIRRRLGITWRAGIRNSLKEIDLKKFLECLKGLDIVLVVLQRNPTQKEIALVRSYFPDCIDASSLNENLLDLIPMLGSLCGMAGVSNTNFYLAAHLRVRSYFLIKSPPDFRFGVSQSQSPWFPDALVYRQSVTGEWDETLLTLREQLICDFGLKGQSANECSLRLMQQRQFEEALECLVSEASFDDLSVCNLAGQIYRELGEYEKSLKYLRMAEQKLPDHPVIVNSLAQTLFKMNDMSSLDILRRFDFSEPVLVLNLAGMLNELGRYSEALKLCESGIREKVLLFGFYKNYIIAAFHLGLYKQAKDAAKEVMFEPLSPQERLELTDYLSVLASLSEEEELAWQTYRARPSTRSVFRDINEFHLPPLEQIQGKSLWVASEQGLGDELFFLRWIPELIRLGVSKIAYAPSIKLKPLLESQKGLGFELLPFQTFEPDVCLMAGDLPEISRVYRDERLNPIRLFPASDICNRLQNELKHYPRPYIGITYRAGIHSGDRVSRSLFKAIDPNKLGQTLCGFPGTLILLQRHPENQEIRDLEEGFRGKILRYEKLNEDLLSMLSMLNILDEYICVSNTNLYLRESLGLLSRVLIPHPPEFRWGLGEQSPWIRNTKIYRQNYAKIWDNCLSLLRKDLDGIYV